jgi:hypothetical protein
MAEELSINETYRMLRDHSQIKRTQNRDSSRNLLEARNIEFEIKNNGAHLIVKGKNGLIDFWPGTGKFKTRSGIHGRGVFNLIKICRKGWRI